MLQYHHNFGDGTYGQNVHGYSHGHRGAWKGESGGEGPVNFRKSLQYPFCTLLQWGRWGGGGWGRGRKVGRYFFQLFSRPGWFTSWLGGGKETDGRDGNVRKQKREGGGGEGGWSSDFRIKACFFPLSIDRSVLQQRLLFYCTAAAHIKSGCFSAAFI